MKAEYTSVTFEEAKAVMDKEKEYIIIDVREEEEFITGHANGAELLPVDNINEKTAAELIESKDMPVMLYCRTGSRSDLAARKLCSMGYTRVYNLGSLSGWPYGIVYGW
ncbi:MAG: rhodanese-like domain-containing protein [Clostridia bacterium]|nr:rhodanese-like domain-containing protein [Clostridia bacterium]